ncbi:MAG: aminotransferase class I/II-fold pyridoxal phosphate-dependent enzyme [Actinomycetota bacterium]
MNWSQWVTSQNDAVRAEGRWRAIKDLDLRGPSGVIESNSVVSFASNDYLGLTAHPAVMAGARDALDRWGAGSGSARLIVGSRPIHSQLELALARWKGTEAAVLFPNGFAANLGVLATLGTSDVTIFSDERNHASIIDGCRAARASVVIFDHLDYDSLGEELARAPRSIVVTDTVFSMDGDVADVARLAELCRTHGALLVVDEAHAVLGPHVDLTDMNVMRIGTLSKFLGAMGGFVAGDREFIDLLINRARTFIFTTASSPADAGAALAAVNIYCSDEGARLRSRLRSLVDLIAPGHPSPIVPIIVGGEHETVKASAALLERGMVVPAIRPPSVAPGTSRLRVTLSAAHTDDQVESLRIALDEVVGRA